MFLFKSPYMYLVIASAIGIGMASVFLIKRFAIQTIDHQPIVFKEREFHKGVVWGGTLFDMGWAITGACPGPIYAQIGAGTVLTLVTFLGAIGGMCLYAFLQQKLPHGSFGQPRISISSSN